MEISKNDIVDAIMKLRQAGKKLPQTDRIKSAANRVEEEQKVLGETINIFCKIFIGRLISKLTWDDAVEKAMLRYDANASVITPSLLQVCLDETAKENQINNAYEQPKDFKPLDDEERYASLSAIKWTSITMKERRNLYKQGKDAISDYVRDNKSVMANAISKLGINEAEARKYLLILKCWDNDLVYSADQGKQPKSFIGFDGDGNMRLMYKEDVAL